MTTTSDQQARAVQAGLELRKDSRTTGIQEVQRLIRMNACSEPGDFLFLPLPAVSASRLGARRTWNPHLGKSCPRFRPHWAMRCLQREETALINQRKKK
jgi:hypothetical protein